MLLLREVSKKGSGNVINATILISTLNQVERLRKHLIHRCKRHRNHSLFVINELLVKFMQYTPLIF